MIPIRGSVISVRPPIVTISLIFLNVLIFFFEIRVPPEVLKELLNTFGVVPFRQTYWLNTDPLQLDKWLFPLFTSIFLHGGWWHLIGNMLFLWVFGDGVENRLGHTRFLIFYLLSGICAAQLQIAVAPNSIVPMIGASGAIAGVLGAYLVFYPRAFVIVMIPVFIFPLFFEVPAFLFLFIWFFQQLMAGAIFTLSGWSHRGGVAWWAHVGGFIGGIILSFILADRKHLGYRQRKYYGLGKYSDRY